MVEGEKGGESTISIEIMATLAQTKVDRLLLRNVFLLGGYHTFDHPEFWNTLNIDACNILDTYILT